MLNAAQCITPRPQRLYRRALISVNGIVPFNLFLKTVLLAACWRHASVCSRAPKLGPRQCQLAARHRTVEENGGQQPVV